MIILEIKSLSKVHWPILLVRIHIYLGHTAFPYRLSIQMLTCWADAGLSQPGKRVLPHRCPLLQSSSCPVSQTILTEDWSPQAWNWLISIHRKQDWYTCRTEWNSALESLTLISTWVVGVLLVWYLVSWNDYSQNWCFVHIWGLFGPHLRLQCEKY